MLTRRGGTLAAGQNYCARIQYPHKSYQNA